MTKLKLSILTVLTLIITSSLFYSCSNEDSVGIENEKVDFLNELKAFNTNYQLTVIDVQENPILLSKGDDDCGFWCGLANVVVVAGADLAGAAAGVEAVATIAGAITAASGGTGAPAGAAVVVGGAVVGAAAGSILAGREIINSERSTTNYKKNDFFGKKLFIKNLNINYPTDYSFLKKVGKLHNLEIYTHNNGLSQRNTEISDFETVKNTEEWKIFIKKIENITQTYVNNNFNTTELTKLLFNDGLISKDIENVLNVFYNIYNNIQIDQNVQDIVNFYINAISNSTVLSYKDKVALISAFSVASESPYFWLNQN